MCILVFPTRPPRLAKGFSCQSLRQPTREGYWRAVMTWWTRTYGEDIVRSRRSSDSVIAKWTGVLCQDGLSCKCGFRTQDWFLRFKCLIVFVCLVCSPSLAIGSSPRPWFTTLLYVTSLNLHLLSVRMMKESAKSDNVYKHIAVIVQVIKQSSHKESSKEQIMFILAIYEDSVYYIYTKK